MRFLGCRIQITLNSDIIITNTFLDRLRTYRSIRRICLQFSFPQCKTLQFPQSRKFKTHRGLVSFCLKLAHILTCYYLVIRFDVLCCADMSATTRRGHSQIQVELIVDDCNRDYILWECMCDNAVGCHRHTYLDLSYLLTCSVRVAASAALLLISSRNSSMKFDPRRLQPLEILRQLDVRRVCWMNSIDSVGGFSSMVDPEMFCQWTAKARQVRKFEGQAGLLYEWVVFGMLEIVKCK